MAVDRYRVQVDGRWLDVSIEAVEPGLRVRCGDKEWDVDLQQYSDTNLVSVLLSGQSLQFLIEKFDDLYSMLREWEQYDVRVKPAWASAKGPGTSEAAGPAEVAIDSPLVGVVAEVAVQRGQKVERGDLLLVIEAMKMQNEIRTPRAGTVKAVRVKTGQKVSMRQPLLVLS